MRDNNVTWRELIADEMGLRGETMADVVAIAPQGLDMDRKFYSGYGCTEGVPFTLWTKRRVYFPTEYDGAEGVRSVPRDPCDEATEHV